MATRESSLLFDGVFPLGLGLDPHYKAGGALIALFSRLAGARVLVDTAEAYGTERFVKEAALPRDLLFISTKVSPEHILGMRQAITSSLRRLGVEDVDLYLTHRLDPSVTLAATLEKLVSLKREGLARHIGLCNVSLTTLKEARALCPEIEVVQCYYSSAYTLPEKAMIPYCVENNVSFMAYSPLKYVKDKREGLRYVLGREVLPLVMTNDEKHLRENVATVRQAVMWEDA